MLNKILIIALSILFFSVSQAHAQCKLISTWEPWEPYQFKDKNGKITGLDNDLIKAIAKHADCEISLQKRPWKRTLAELKSGDSDMAPGASFSEERTQFAHFSEPYRSETMSLMVRRDEVEKLNFSSVEEMMQSDIALGTVRGYFYGERFKIASEAADKKARLQEANSDEKNIKKLLKGRIDGLLVDPFVGMQIAKELNKHQELTLHPVEVSDSDIYFMFSKKSVSKQTIDRINKALAEIKKSGEYDQIVNSYLK